MVLGSEPTGPAQCFHVGGSPLHASQCLDFPLPPTSIYTSCPFLPTFTPDALLPPRGFSHSRPADHHRVEGHFAPRTTSAPICSPSAYWAQALSCRNYLFSPLNPFLHEKQNKRIIFPCPVKVCSCPLSLPVVEPEEISQIGSEKEADDSAFRGGKHTSDSIHQHINLQLYIHLRLCLLFSGEP